LIPLGLLVTVPLPVPAFATVSEYEVTGAGANVALTVCHLLIVTVQEVLVPLHAPPHVTVAPAAGVAVRVTTALAG